MTKKLKAVFASLLCACVAATLGITACTPEQDDSGNIDPDIFAIYTAYAEEAGDTAMSYSEWYAKLLEEAKGAKGDKGEPGEPGTPGAQGVGVKNITVNDEGVLVITLTNDEVLTLGKVVGADGKDGKDITNVEINAEDQLVVTYSDSSTQTVGNVKGVGIQNIQIVESSFKFTMTDGTDISVPIPNFIHTHTYQSVPNTTVEPTCTSLGYKIYRCLVSQCNDEKIVFTSAKGHSFNSDPDFNSATCTEKGLATYICTECGTTKAEVASAKGHKYGDGGVCEVCGVKNEVISLHVDADGSSEPVDIPADIAAVPGVYIVEADMGASKLSTGRLTMKVDGKEVNSELVYSSIHSTAGEHEVYFGYIQIAESDSQITFSAKNESVDAQLTFKAYEMPTLLTDGTPVEVPVNLSEKSDFKFKIDNSIAEKSYLIKITDCSVDKTNYGSAAVGQLIFHIGSINVTCVSISFSTGTTITIGQSELTGLSADNYEIYAYVGTTATTHEIFPITITLTEK